MMRDRSDDDGDDECALLDLPASLRTAGGDGATIGRAVMMTSNGSESYYL